MFIIVCFIPYEDKVKLFENNVLRRANEGVKKSDLTRNSVVSAVWALLIVRVTEMGMETNAQVGHTFP
jgi:hypothetical protein